MPPVRSTLSSAARRAASRSTSTIRSSARTSRMPVGRSTRTKSRRSVIARLIDRTTCSGGSVWSRLARHDEPSSA